MDTANLYFQQYLPYNSDISDINEFIVEFQTTLYNYVKINFGNYIKKITKCLTGNLKSV